MSAIPAPIPHAARPSLRRLGPWLLAALVAVAAAVAVNHFASAGSHARASVPLYTAPGHAFRIALPRGWHASAGDGATAVLTRADRRGMIAVRPAPALHGSPQQITRDLASRLAHTFKGFRAVSARVTRIRGGAAIVYTFVRDPAGTVQTLMIAPAGGRLWEVDAVMPGSAADVARQSGAMLATFGS